MTRWITALCAVALLGLGGCLIEDSCYDTPTPPPAGDRSDLTVAGLDGARYSISEVESCSHDDPIFSFVVSGTGQQPLYEERSPNAAILWFEEHILTRLYDEGRYWDVVWYESYPCNGDRPGLAVSTDSWAEANAIAKLVARELAADDRQGGIAILLHSYVYCAA